MKRGLISSVLTLMFAQKGITDNTDLMRCNILAMHIEHLCFTEMCTEENVKNSSAYLGCHYDVSFPDEFLTELVTKALDLYNSQEKVIPLIFR